MKSKRNGLIEDKISVIVPAYNVKNYLTRCVKSITEQTYSNLEIILVDDGSFDGTSELCDEISSKDSRIIVKHKENGGLSDARNAGLDIATGAYVSFIDGDDYIDCHMYEAMENIFHLDNVSLVSCGMFFKDIDGTGEIRTMSRETIVLTRKESYRAFFSICNRILGVSCCNKLFRRKLFDDIRFKKGIISEDIELLYRILDLCENVVCINQAYYYYIKRSNSITTCIFNRGNLDVINTIEDIIKFITVKYPEVIEDARLFELEWLVNRWVIMFDSSDKKYSAIRKSIEKKIRHNLNTYKNKKIFMIYDYRELFAIAWAISLRFYIVVKTLLKIKNNLKNLKKIS